MYGTNLERWKDYPRCTKTQESRKADTQYFAIPSMHYAIFSESVNNKKIDDTPSFR